MSEEIPLEIVGWLGRLYDEVENLTSTLQPALQLGAMRLTPSLLSEGCKPLYAVYEHGFGGSTNLDFQCNGGYIILFDMPDFNNTVMKYRVFIVRRGDEEDVRKFNEELKNMLFFVIDNAYIIVPGRVQVEKDLYFVGFSNMPLTRALYHGWPIMVYGGARAMTYAIPIIKHEDITLVRIVVQWQYNSSMITSAYEHREGIEEKIRQIMDVAKPLLKIGATYILY
jgi:hypothetical protein